MTSETLHVIKLLETQLVADYDLWGKSVAPAFLESESGSILYRPQGDTNSYDHIVPDDRFGNWFYLRYKGGEAINHSSGEYVSPTIREGDTNIPMRFVGVFYNMDYYEVLDRVINEMLLFADTCKGMQFNSAHGFNLDVLRSYIDLIGQFPDETDNRFISYSPDLLTIGIDFNLNFTRDASRCRQFVTKKNS
jgi:hypothetical protein